MLIYDTLPHITKTSKIVFWRKKNFSVMVISSVGLCDYVTKCFLFSSFVSLALEISFSCLNAK